jgi:hypothetical protein
MIISRQTPAISIFGNNFQLIQFHCSLMHIAGFGKQMLIPLHQIHLIIESISITIFFLLPSACSA